MSSDKGHIILITSFQKIFGETILVFVSLVLRYDCADYENLIMKHCGIFVTFVYLLIFAVTQIL